jgi:16S rRNA (uracil1498-N3)-methyltransferase
VVRIFLPSSHVTDNRLSIKDEKAHYLLSVLRCRKGDRLIVFDGSGTCFMTVIKEARRREVFAEILETFSCNLESPLDCILVQGILKGEKMDMVIQKTTELGVKEIVPAVTERSQLRDTRRVKRWRKIAEEASRQSGRSVVPAVHEPVELKKVLTSCAPQSMHRGFIFYEEGGMKLSEAVKVFSTKGSRNPSPLVGGGKGEGELLILIGPEGGFTKEEVNFAEESGLTVISLGKRILKAETAAISAVTLVQYLFGDMG